MRFTSRALWTVSEKNVIAAAPNTRGRPISGPSSRVASMPPAKPSQRPVEGRTGKPEIPERRTSSWLLGG
jgi:hypothetical protein